MSPDGATRAAASIAGAAAVSACAVGIGRGSFAAGGSDSSCYLSAAQLFSRGVVSFREPLATVAPWRDAILSFAPAGHVPGTVPGTFVPMCPPGLPVAMSLFHLLRIGPFLVVPVLGALAIWLMFLLGRRIDRPLTGAAAAVLTACSPIFLYQIVQPMTDVPAAAWWLLAVVSTVGSSPGRPNALVAGMATSAAVLTRPNVAPVALVVCGGLIAMSAREDRVRGLAKFAAGTVPGVLAVFFFQQAMYGSATATGYGPAASLFSAANVLPNAARYASWIIGAHTPFLVAALGAPFVLERRAEGWFLLAIAAAVLGCYLPYIVFDDWWYIRFLMPAIPLLIALAVTVLVAGADRLAARNAGTMVVVFVTLLAVWYTRVAAERHAFGFAESERHYVNAGRYVADRLPITAIVLTVRNSGSVHYYAGRPIVLWDLLAPEELDAGLSFVRSQGRTPFLMLEADEEPVFRARFGRASAIGALDWPPVAQIGRTVRVYDPADRARYLAGGRVRTEFLQGTGGREQGTGDRSR